VSKERPSNLASSVHQRLINISRETGADPNHILSRFAIERLLYRLSSSDHTRDFVLKGAMLFMVWTGKIFRPTYDLDLLGFGEDSAKRITGIFKSLCRLKVEPDGLTFDPKSVETQPIREDEDYHGQRVTLNAFLGNARLSLQIDIGFGDAITPRAEKVDFPTLLAFPVPRLRACPRETVIAEKLHAMTTRGMMNSRMKDFHDVYVLARDFAFNGIILTKAVKMTFQRRKTAIPTETPLALTEEFSRNHIKNTQWKAFIRKGNLGKNLPEFPNVIAYLQNFLVPLLNGASGQESAPKYWKPGGPWAVG